MKLYNFFGSGTSFRTRIALNLKGLSYDYVPVDLRIDAHAQADYQAVSADRLVPTLDVAGNPDHALLGQSMAIIEYLDETHPEPPLLPKDALGRARVRELAQTMACDVHPINNRRVLLYLTGQIKVSDEQKITWYNHWVMQGLQAYERRLERLAAERAAAGLAPSVYSYGETPTLADCCLIPQMVNGRRFGLVYEGIPRTQAVFDACMQLPAFERAHPKNCPDAG